MPRQPKTPVKRGPGRPKLHDQAKSSIVPIRFSAEDRRKVEAAATAQGQTVSEWVRSTINANL
jgi:predicted HicB family RNase H-like nuclease